MEARDKEDARHIVVVVADAVEVVEVVEDERQNACLPFTIRLALFGHSCHVFVDSGWRPSVNPEMVKLFSQLLCFTDRL